MVGMHVVVGAAAAAAASATAAAAAAAANFVFCQALEHMGASGSI